MMQRPPRAGALAAQAIGLAGHAVRGRLFHAPIDVTGWIGRQFARETEHRRLFAWLPVAFGIGILLYFAADTEPSFWPPLCGLILFGALAFRSRHRWHAQVVLIVFAAVLAGFLAAVLRTAGVSAPVLSRTASGPLSGFIESVEDRIDGARIVIVTHAFATLAKAATPHRVRITTRGRTEVKPGDFVAVTARLLPPPEPARPGGYDFAREAYFRGIGAVGSAAGTFKVMPPPSSPGWRLALAAKVDEARNILTKRIAQAFGGQSGAVAAALVTGKRGLIAEETNDALRAAGIYHIVSISGLHMVLAAGTFFWTARAAMALFPGLALVWPVKKIAALVAMAGATAYCIFSGSEVATERSLAMTLVMLGAILVDRPALSMRNLAIAALIVLAREPESLLGPSFQMSFAAVAGLIAFCEHPRSRAGEGGGGPRDGPIMRLCRSLWRATGMLVLTTMVATLATAAFGAYHFQTLNPLGVIGNALALPFVSLVVMPAAVAGTLAYPFGLDTPIWWLMGFATQPVLLAGEIVSGITRSTVLIPAFGTLALGALAAGLLWLTLWSTALRWFAVLPAAIGVALAATPERAALMVDRQAAGAAIRGADGRLIIVGRPSRFVTEQWLKADGDGRDPGDASLKRGVACDRLGCVGRLDDGRAVSIVRDKRAFAEDCRRATIIVSRLDAPRGCRAKLVLDRARLAEVSSVTVLKTGDGFALRQSRDARVRRPWLRDVVTSPPASTATGNPRAGTRPDGAEPDIAQ